MNSMFATRGSLRQPTSVNDRARPWIPSMLPSNAQWVSEATTRTVTRMMHVFEVAGGVVSGDELSSLLRGSSMQPISLIARWIVNRQVVTVQWRSQTLLPLFQFDLQGGSLRPPIERVIAELTGVFDELELAIWFTQPNSWLAGASPVHVLGHDVPAVLGAARADRFVAMG